LSLSTMKAFGPIIFTFLFYDEIKGECASFP
jgi:hypothetical protein